MKKRIVFNWIIVTPYFTKTKKGQDKYPALLNPISYEKTICIYVHSNQMDSSSEEYLIPFYEIQLLRWLIEIMYVRMRIRLKRVLSENVKPGSKSFSCVSFTEKEIKPEFPALCPHKTLFIYVLLTRILTPSL